MLERAVSMPLREVDLCFGCLQVLESARSKGSARSRFVFWLFTSARTRQIEGLSDVKKSQSSAFVSSPLREVDLCFGCLQVRERAVSTPLREVDLCFGCLQVLERAKSKGSAMSCL